ncbi:methyltransferase domain-containing protein [Hydrogenophaga soli]
MLNAEYVPNTLFPNQEFYRLLDGANRIMNPKNYPKQIEQFLMQEKGGLESIFRRISYDCIVEIGCFDGSNSTWVRDFCIQYYGIDVNSEAISRAARLGRADANVKFLCISAENFVPVLRSSLEGFKRKAVFLPFNIVGNFINPAGILKNFFDANFDIVMSVFNTKSETVVGRHLYYQRCFGTEEEIEVHETGDGILFRVGDVFQSMAYSSEKLRSIVEYVGVGNFSCNHHTKYGELHVISKVPVEGWR